MSNTPDLKEAIHAEIAEKAQAKCDVLARTERWMHPQNVEAHAEAILESLLSRQGKQQRLILLVNEMNKAIAPFIPCKKRCSACCHIPVAVFESEAKAIAKVSKRKAAKVEFRHPGTIPQAIAHFRGVPCPFLKDDSCSIYDIRPFACRQQSTMNPDNSQCQISIPSEESCVTHFPSFETVHLAHAKLALMNGEVAGDIREFFPPK